MFGWSAAHLALAAMLALLLGAGSTAIVAVYLVRLSPDHFVAACRPPLRFRSPLARAAAFAAKNLFGLVLFGAGAIMAIPGVPGQGVLTMLVGLLLLDLPGKRKLELALLRRPAVLRAINRLRARFSRPALLRPTLLPADESPIAPRDS